MKMRTLIVKTYDFLMTALPMCCIFRAGLDQICTGTPHSWHKAVQCEGLQMT